MTASLVSGLCITTGRFVVVWRYAIFVSLLVLLAITLCIRRAVVACLIADARAAMESGNYELSLDRLWVAGFLDVGHPQIALLRNACHAISLPNHTHRMKHDANGELHAKQQSTQAFERSEFLQQKF